MLLLMLQATLVVSILGSSTQDPFASCNNGSCSSTDNVELLQTQRKKPTCSRPPASTNPGFVPGGSLNPTTIPKFVTPMVIPPVMKSRKGTSHSFDIAVRPLKQQILPGGIWNNQVWGQRSCDYDFPATDVFAYGPATDPLPDSTALGGGVGIAPAPNSQFNYPGYTVENEKDVETEVNWINDLIQDPWSCTEPHYSDLSAMQLDANTSGPYHGYSAYHSNAKCKRSAKDREFIQHLHAVDRSIHWANPEKLPCEQPGKTLDCTPDPAQQSTTLLNDPYDGPVPMVVHVHGSHTTPDSDGYPEAWYMPDASNIGQYASQGTFVNKFDPQPDTNVRAGVAHFAYPNDAPSATTWYHDHTLGMTRLNVYTGQAGFWLRREKGGGETGLESGVLPHPAPKAGESFEEVNLPPGRGTYREIPIVIQDMSFNSDGTIFYAASRTHFELPDQLNIPYRGNNSGVDSDMPAIWNPESFFNVMVVNGVAWPHFEVEPDLYRFRLLNGCDSRIINIALYVYDDATQSLDMSKEIPFYQFGGDQGLLPFVVEVKTGSQKVVKKRHNDNKYGSYGRRRKGIFGKGWQKSDVPPEQALLMGNAERADVIVDFRGFSEGTKIRMINTGPDEPFGGFNGFDPADPETTGLVMEFVVKKHKSSYHSYSKYHHHGRSKASDPEDIVPRSAQLPEADRTRKLSLREAESAKVCVTGMPPALLQSDAKTGLKSCGRKGKLSLIRSGRRASIDWDPSATPDSNQGTCVFKSNNSEAQNRTIYAPLEALLGGAKGDDPNDEGVMWSAPVQVNPALESTEIWELWDWTGDAHPIHIHLVKFKVLSRQAFDTTTGKLVNKSRPPNLNEMGFKDTVIVYPGEITRVKATFDRPGLYVWHCHILSHEDNEMMLPYCVGDSKTAPGCGELDFATQSGNSGDYRQYSSYHQ